MKMQKLDSKQVPQVVALGVLSLGVFGYAVFTFSGSAPKPDTAPKSDAAASASTGAGTGSGVAGSAVASTGAGTGSAVAGSTTAATATTTGTKMALSVAETGEASKDGTQPAPEIALPGQYNPDPFKSAARPVEAPKTVEVTPKPAAPKPSKPGPLLPDARQGAGPLQATAVIPPVPVGPERPEVRVTGTSVVDGMNLAILELGQEHRVVQVGDVVSKGYRVKKIQLQGVVFGKEQDHFFRGVGAKSEPEKSDNTLGKLN